MTDDGGSGAEAVRALASRLGAAWAAGDGDAFAAAFAEDADFIDIRGGHHAGRAAIARTHASIFATVYRGSTATYEVAGTRDLGPGCVLGRLAATVMQSRGVSAGGAAAGCVGR